MAELSRQPSAADQMNPADIAKLAARALKQVQTHVTTAAAEQRAAFRQWLDGGAVHLHNGAVKLPGRAAYRFLRTAQGWAPAA